jgi:hypothetical protein
MKCGRRIHRATSAQQRVVQTLCDLLSEGITGLLKRREDVGLEHLCPQIAVIADRIAVFRKDVPKNGSLMGRKLSLLQHSLKGQFKKSPQGLFTFPRNG